jgi:hypothetical protein
MRVEIGPRRRPYPRSSARLLPLDDPADGSLRAAATAVGGSASEPWGTIRTAMSVVI